MLESGGTNSCFLKASLCWRQKQLLSKLKASLCWRQKQLLSKGIPTLEVQTIAFWINPYAEGTTLRWWYIPMLVVPTPLTFTPKKMKLPPLATWTLAKKPQKQNFHHSTQARRQDLAAGGPKTRSRRGAYFQNTLLDACTMQQPVGQTWNQKWEGTDFKWRGHAQLAPLLVTGLVQPLVILAKKHCLT